MHFIITRFLRMIIRDYQCRYTLTQLPDKSLLCTITDIPFELKAELVKLKYSMVIGQRDIFDKNKVFVRTEAVSEEVPVCQGIYNPLTGSHGIKVTFDNDTYADKCNKIDYTFRRYYENHSLIDQINRKG